MPKVYNLRDKHRISIPRDAVYCGRGTPYGNPFIGGQHGSRETVIRKFVEQVLPDLDVSALRGKDLVCWCVPLPCHCNSILKKANTMNIDAIAKIEPQFPEYTSPEPSLGEIVFRYYQPHFGTTEAVELTDRYFVKLAEAVADIEGL